MITINFKTFELHFLSVQSQLITILETESSIVNRKSMLLYQSNQKFKIVK